MFSPKRDSALSRPPGRGAVAWLAAALVAWGRLFAAEAEAPVARSVSPVLITSFDQIWRMDETEQKEWHRLRMDYVVYYYDPLWQAMWGRSGEADSYLSLGSKIFPIKPRQRILVEGLILPASGMAVEEPKITVLAESAPVEILATAGDIGNTERFNKRLVTVEGYVDRQIARDANHQELDLVVEGRPMLAHFLVRNAEFVPQLKGALVRLQGVYFARSEPTWTTPRLELWVPGLTSIEMLGDLDRDLRFNLPATPISGLAAAAPEALVRLQGTVQAQQPGRSLTLRDETGVITIPTVQLQPVAADERVEVIGWPARRGNEWSLRQGLYRPAKNLVTSFGEWQQAVDRQPNVPHRLRLECIAHYFDPQWKVVWVSLAGEDGYLSLGGTPVPVRPGQRILVEGDAVPANGLVIDEPTVTVLAERVELAYAPTRGQIGQTEFFDKRPVVVEGLVDRQSLSDPTHLRLDLVTEGRAVVARWLFDGSAPPAVAEGAQVRVKGVYSATADPLGALPRLEVWVQGNENVEITGSLAKDARFEAEVTPVEKIGAVAPGRLVRVAGVVRAQQPGRSLRMRDETGQVTLLTAQTAAMPLGEPVEAIGYPELHGVEWQLRESVYRRLRSAPPPTAQGLSQVRLAEQLLDLSPEEAALSHPVQLNGVVTWENPAAEFFYIRDASGGACVIRPPDHAVPLKVGAKVAVSGVSASGRFVPVVMAASLVRTATMELPEAKEVTLEQALTGIEEAQWITMSGYVREITRDGPWGRLELLATGGRFDALLPWSDRLQDLRNSVVRVRGVCSALANATRQLTGIQLWVPSPQFLEIEEAKPADLFAVGLRSIASLRQYSSLHATNRLVRIAGVVAQHRPGKTLYLQDDREGLLVLSRGTDPLVPGDRVEVVGLAGRESSRLVLREAVYRRLAPGKEAVPIEIGAPDGLNVEFDSRLARVEATLLEVSAHEEGTRLILQANGMISEALVDVERSEVPGYWTPGCRVALTGIYLVQFDEFKRPHTAQLQLRSAQDVRILSRPSWWTAGRALAATGVLAVALVLGFGWVIALRRRVQRQTGQIREQIESEKAARLEAALARASKLESLGVLAGGIAHDFNNLLTVVMGNLSLASLDPNLERETVQCLRESERAAQRARDLTQQLITFAKGGAPVRAVADLPAVVREAMEFALHGSKVRCDFAHAPDLWPADIDKGQIGQAVHNIIINAAHAMPDGGVVRITLRNELIAEGARPAPAPGRYLRLAISDSGTGIAPENLPRIFEPYFTTKTKGTGLGLATVYSIIKKHHGHLEVESVLGQGTTFQIWLPAAEMAAPPPEAPTVAASKGIDRILLMDDEEPIRVMTGALLKRKGFDVTAVADGAEAVREYAAAKDLGRPFKLVMLDLTVPGGMGGAEAMERLRLIDPAICAVVSSGYSSDPVMASFQAYGFRGRVTKPYDMASLFATIKDLIPDRVDGEKLPAAR